jgi:hypothetical protein
MSEEWAAMNQLLRFSLTATCLLTLLTQTPARADSVFISNQPFKGYTRGVGSSCLVELQAFAQALGYSVKPLGGGFLIVKDPGSAETSDQCRAGVAVLGTAKMNVVTGPGGQDLVSIADFCSAAGVKVVPNRSTQTIDVYPSGAGAPVASTSASPVTTSSGIEPAAGAAESTVMTEPGKAALQFYKNFALLPPIRDMKELRDFSSHEADLDHFKKAYRASVTPEYYAATWPELVHFMAEMMEASSRIAQVPAAEIDRAMASDAQLREKCEVVMKAWEGIRRLSATFVSERKEGEGAVVTVRVYIVNGKTGRSRTERAGMHMVHEDLAWKVGKNPASWASDK